MTDYEFIKEFREIKMTDICKRLKIQQTNIITGKTSDENLRKIKEEIMKELAGLFTKDVTNSEKLITLYLYDELLTKLEKENRMLREMI
jgi:hypothetical protein